MGLGLVHRLIYNSVEMENSLHIVMMKKLLWIVLKMRIK